jgi:hypothetical protein
MLIWKTIKRYKKGELLMKGVFMKWVFMKRGVLPKLLVCLALAVVFCLTGCIFDFKENYGTVELYHDYDEGYGSVYLRSATLYNASTGERVERKTWASFDMGYRDWTVFDNVQSENSSGSLINYQLIVVDSDGDELDAKFTVGREKTKKIYYQGYSLGVRDGENKVVKTLTVVSE